MVRDMACSGSMRLGTDCIAVFVGGRTCRTKFRASRASTIRTRREAKEICRGADGKAQIAMYPKLAGQNRPCLVSALKSCRNGDRKSAMAGMPRPNVTNLPDEGIEDLAACYHGLQP